MCGGALTFDQTKSGNKTYSQLCGKEAASVLSASSRCQCSAIHWVWLVCCRPLATVSCGWQPEDSFTPSCILHLQALRGLVKGEKQLQDADDLFGVSGLNELSEKNGGQNAGSPVAVQWLVKYHFGCLLKNQFVGYSWNVRLSGIRSDKSADVKMLRWNFQHGGTCADGAVGALNERDFLTLDVLYMVWPWPHSQPYEIALKEQTIL